MSQTTVTTTDTEIASIAQPDDSLSIIDMFMICLRHWPWFIVSLFFFLGAATLYLLSTPKTYTRTTSILVKNSSDDRLSYESRFVDELSAGNIASTIADEIVAIHSPAVIYELVKRLHLDYSYYRPGFFLDHVLYAASLPVEVEIADLEDDAWFSFDLRLNGDGSATLSDINLRDESIRGSSKVTIGKKCKTPLGIITIKPTLYYNKEQRTDILVNRSSLEEAAALYGSLISADLQKKTRNIIDLRCVDNSIPRAENILKTVVNIYNENWVANRNQVSISTNEFIKERLAVIESELGDVEGDIASYKSSQGMLTVEQAASQAVSKEAAADQLRQTISNHLYMVRYVRNYVTDPAHAKQLMPASTGIGNAAIEAQIAEYNNRVLERNNLVSNSSEQNPLVTDLDNSLTNLRSAILNSLDNAQQSLKAQLDAVQAVHGAALSRLTSAPRQKKHLLSYERQQKVKESLYLFLLQKREENELSQAFTAYNTRIIANPHGKNAPTSPNKNMILLLAFALALAVPAAYFILRENLNSKVRGRKDLENLSIPYVGELPLWRPKKGEETTVDNSRFVVRQHSRDIVNEAYRVVRTNLEFMTNEEKQCKIIMLTSFNPGSGKTFITANLGASFAIRGSCVLCIDLDLRRGSLSEYVGKPKHGITSYLGGRTDTYADLIVHHNLGDVSGTDDDKEKKDGPFIDFLPMGKIPPNPTELLYSSKLKPMLDKLRQQYDYIFIDCPPVEIVADATIISREADLTLFVVRAGLLERSMLPELQKNYDEKKYNNMAMVLNATDAEHHYGYHRYGYGYGRYGYGYGYGKRYGYGYYGSSSDKSSHKSKKKS